MLDYTSMIAIVLAITYGVLSQVLRLAVHRKKLKRKKAWIEAIRKIGRDSLMRKKQKCQGNVSLGGGLANQVEALLATDTGDQKLQTEKVVQGTSSHQPK